MNLLRPAALLATLCLVATAHAQPSAKLLDDFSDPAAWRPAASEDVKAEAVRGSTGGLCLRYDFGAVSGYAVLRRALPIDIPEHYAFVLRLSGRGAANALQFKLVDDSGDNVWWMNRPGFEPPAQPTELVIRQRQVSFAWGPTADRRLRRAAAIEIVVARGEGGAGELCLESLTLRTLGPPRPLPAAEAWQPQPGRAPTWQVELAAPGERTEIAGLSMRWAEGRRARDFDIAASDDGTAWRPLRAVRGNRRDVLAIELPGAEARYVRLTLRGEARAALDQIRVVGPEEWPDRNAALRALAQASPRGRMPRAFVGEQNYWTLVGVDGGGARSALLSEDGAIEPARGGPSLEPFVIDDHGAVVSWADVEITPSLPSGHLPLPRVAWSGRGLALTIDAAADGPAAQPRLLARYRLTNTGDAPRDLSLALALRPWQVNPPSQFLNTPGGFSPVDRIEQRGRALWVDGAPWLQMVQAPDAFSAGSFALGDPLQPPTGGAAGADAQGLASAAMRWRWRLAPGETRTVSVEWPCPTPAGDARGACRADAPAALSPAQEDALQARVDERFTGIADHWRARLNRVGFHLPPAAQPLADTLRSSLAQILVSRDGPALQPGTRSYARAWIRDGAMMVAGLLRLGETDAASAFVRWYAGHLFANGKVPCCIDARGADPVAENDSPGQLIFAVSQLWRYTGDQALAQSLWPAADAAARYMEQLRQSERKAGQPPGFFGMMPASISHEGYSAKPMHSYWDNFWALAGYRAAVPLARALGHGARADELALQRDAFEADLGRSLADVVAHHRIDFLPGAAELGDFDPSSSTMIFSPAGGEALVPRSLLESTWERYWRESVERAEGRRDWIDYTPYELRSVSAFVRLGQPERARALLAYFLKDRRPAAWNQWAEVVGRQMREPRFVGDMPHAWISSDFIRSALDLFAYERESDGALVLGAGIDPAWWEARPLEITGLRSAYGPLDLALRRAGPDTVELRLQHQLKPLPGGLWFAWPGDGPPPPATIDGRDLAWQGRQIRLPQDRPGALVVTFRIAASNK